MRRCILSTDALRRFISRRGKSHTFINDNGSNLVEDYQKLRRSLNDLDQSVIGERLKRQEIRWKFNPPHASGMGGIWERVIRTMKRVLSAICADQASSVDVLLTLFAETKHIVNSRLVTPVVMDPKGGKPLTPNQLLILC